MLWNSVDNRGPLNQRVPILEKRSGTPHRVRNLHYKSCKSLLLEGLKDKVSAKNPSTEHGHDWFQGLQPIHHNGRTKPFAADQRIPVSRPCRAYGTGACNVVPERQIRTPQNRTSASYCEWDATTARSREFGQSNPAPVYPTPNSDSPTVLMREWQTAHLRTLLTPRLPIPP